MGWNIGDANMPGDSLFERLSLAIVCGELFIEKLWVAKLRGQ
jgi:hypothetical protein